MKLTKLFFSICIILSVVFSTTAVTSCDQNTFKLNYLTDGNGYIDGECEQTVRKGEDGDIVEAIANEGYQFVKWSDGNTSSKRKDGNIETDKEITAIFEKEVYEIKYVAYGGGHIVGECDQSVKYGENASLVAAVPDDGYLFIGWSDGIQTETRQDCGIIGNAEYRAVFRIKESFRVVFDTTKGGKIIGNKEQYVIKGEDTDYVTAVAEEGYEFKGWSDGEISSNRKINSVVENISVTAIFEKISQTFKYDYNDATNNCDEDQVTITRDNLSVIKFIIPEREGYEFCGWFLDCNLMTKVGSSEGFMLMDEEIFDYNSDTLYAKWVSKDASRYSILMVNVVEIDADLTLYGGETVHLQYKQNDMEKQIHEYAAKEFSGYLNSFFNGDVIFDVLTVNTALPLGSNNLTPYYAKNFIGYTVFADKIPELQDIYKNFDVVITTVNFNDYENRYHNIAGAAYHNLVGVNAEELWGIHILNGYPEEWLLDKTKPNYDIAWEGIMGTYLHEFIHTVEFQVEELEHSLHIAIGENSMAGSESLNIIELCRQYLLGILEINGNTYGIPQQFWDSGGGVINA